MNDLLLEPTEFIVIEVVDATSPFNITGAENARSVNITIFDVTERKFLTIVENNYYYVIEACSNPWTVHACTIDSFFFFFFFNAEMNFNPMIQAVNAMGTINTIFEEGSILSLRLQADDINIQGDGIIQFYFIIENGTAGKIGGKGGGGGGGEENDESV